jgi:hypothetical protein
LTANIFCDFANKEIRRVYGLYANLTEARHQRVIAEWIRIAVLLSPDWALFPLGFVAESSLLQRALAESEELLFARVLRLSVRDSQIGKFIERRRGEYQPYRSDYAPLFRDETIELLLRYSVAIHERIGNTAQEIGGRWSAALETEPALQCLRSDLNACDLDKIADLPYRIHSEGLGLTWNAVADRLPPMRVGSGEALRRYLHREFVRGYLREYDLEVITGLPYGWRDLGVQPRGGPADYERFQACVEPLRILTHLLQLSGSDLLALRREPGFLYFQKLYRDLAASTATIRELRLAFSNAAAQLAPMHQSFLSTWCQIGFSLQRRTEEAIPLLAHYLSEAAHRAVARVTPAPELGPHFTGPRVYLEDISEFQAASEICDADTLPHLKQGRVDISEDDIQASLEQLLSVPFHRKDWGGETNDLYTSNVHLKNRRAAAAFLLKGKGLRAPEMQIAHCGKNGDQILRLSESPARLFVVQYVGPISDAVIKDIADKVSRMRKDGVDAYYCIIDGQQTVKLLIAAGRINKTK